MGVRHESGSGGVSLFFAPSTRAYVIRSGEGGLFTRSRGPACNRSDAGPPFVGVSRPKMEPWAPAGARSANPAPAVERRAEDPPPGGWLRRPGTLVRERRLAPRHPSPGQLHRSCEFERGIRVSSLLVLSGGPGGQPHHRAPDGVRQDRSDELLRCHASRCPPCGGIITPGSVQLL